MRSPKVQVIGSGYVGLATALTLASGGIHVTGVEIDKDKRASINSGKMPFHEPGIPELLQERLRNGFEVSDSLVDSDISFITVGTPSKEDGSIDLTYVESASRILGKFLRDHDGYHTVVVKSTVVPGTTENVVKPAIEAASTKKVGKDIGLCMNPEFLREGSALQDMLEPDRVVIGEYDTSSGDMLTSLYRSFYKEKMPPLLRTNLVNAESIKYASNAFLATKISFINTIANIAQRIPGADVEVIAKGMGFDKRIGNRFLNAGLGYGGSCFPKDVHALIALSKNSGYDPVLLDDVEEVNIRQFWTALELARGELGTLKGKTITLLGLSFKPDTDDTREAVSLRIIDQLLKEGAKIKAYDPVAMNIVKQKHTGIVYSDSALNTLDDADCCIIVTEWSEFKKLEPEDFVSRMKTPILIDGRRIYDPARFSTRLRFSAIGLGSSGKISNEVRSWRNPSLAVNAILRDSSNRIYLVRRNEPPFDGILSLPGGYVEYGETVEEALMREVKEELGVKLVKSHLLGVYSDPTRHPEKHVVALLFQVEYDGLPNIAKSNEISEGSFYDAQNIPDTLAFDHAKMIRDYFGSSKS